jgi:hypothetical protein
MATNLALFLPYLGSTPFPTIQPDHDLMVQRAGNNPENKQTNPDREDYAAGSYFWGG